MPWAGHEKKFSWSTDLANAAADDQTATCSCIQISRAIHCANSPLKLDSLNVNVYF